jgi:probable rRNA maturation factor
VKRSIFSESNMINFQITESVLDLLHAAFDSQALCETAAEQALRFANLEQPAELTLVLTGDEQVHELNRQFRQVDAPTDVLSFPAGDVDPDTGNLYLGDIVISLPRALAQSQDAGNPLEAELRLLVVHGVLHLLGYDHADEEEQAAMWAAQSEILSRLTSE